MHGKKIAKIEKQFIKDIVEINRNSYKKVKPELTEFINKIETLRTVYNDAKIPKDASVPKLVEQTVDIVKNSMSDDKQDFINSFMKYYGEVSTSARENVAKELESVHITTDFINPDVQKYFLTQAGERIDGINETTLYELRNQLYLAYTQKETPSQWEKRIESVMNCDKPKGRAEMIARTELAWAYNQGLINTYKEVGVHKVRWLAVMDNRTCNICRNNHDKVFDLHDLLSIPAHPRCRCTIVSDDNKNIVAKRNIENNPERLANEEMIKNKSSDNKEYEEYKKILGNEIPETVEAFQNMKYNDIEEWKKLKAKYNDSLVTNLLKEHNIELIGKINDNLYSVKNYTPDINDMTQHAKDNLKNKSDRSDMTLEKAKEFIDNGKLVIFDSQRNTIKFMAQNGYTVLNFDNVLVTAVPQKWRNKYNKYLKEE